MSLIEIRRRPTLPGRFQPSTISVLRLNFCVRDGNRWIPQAIVTGNLTGFGSLRCRAEPHIFMRSPSPPFLSRQFGIRTASWLPFRLLALEIAFLRSQLRVLTLSCLAPSKPHRLEDSLRPTMAASLFLTFSHYPLSRSSPRPISITKLHTLPHFHR